MARLPVPDPSRMTMEHRRPFMTRSPTAHAAVSGDHLLFGFIAHISQTRRNSSANIVDTKPACLPASLNWPF